MNILCAMIHGLTMRYKIVSGFLDIEEGDDNTSKLSEIIIMPSSGAPPVCPKPDKHGTVWYKSKSDSKMVNVDGGFEWSPVKKPTTLHTYTNAHDFIPGSVVTCKFKWKSDGMEESNKEVDGTGDLTNQGKGISDKFLRSLAGTGDFRIGFFESGEMVYDDSEEGGEVDTPATEFNDYKGFQVRWHPHLSKGFDKMPGRLIEARGKEREPHNNMSLWTRIERGTFGLMSDQAQRAKHSGFSKSDGWGTQPQSYGAEAPFGKWVDVTIEMIRTTQAEYAVKFTCDGRSAPLLRGKFNKGFAPKKIDCMAITYTNSSRKYAYVHLKDLSFTSLSS